MQRIRKLESYQCRFCLEQDKRRNVIAPCKCKGSAKYIHNSCLLEWYKFQPEKALTCGTCKFKLKTKREYPEEDIQPYSSIYIPNVFSIYIVNSIGYFLVSINLEPFNDFVVNMGYIAYHVIAHTSALTNITHCIGNVKTKKRYWTKWTNDKRWLLPILMLLLLFQYQDFYCMGFALQMLEYMWFVEHFEVLALLNQSGGFYFVNKSTKLTN